MDPAEVFYQCQRCGNCCRWPGIVKVTETEVDRIAVFLGLTPQEFMDRYTALRPDRSGLTLISKPNQECIFLEGPNTCSIQEAKPDQCAGFPNRWNFPGWREVCEAIPVPRDKPDGC